MNLTALGQFLAKSPVIIPVLFLVLMDHFFSDVAFKCTCAMPKCLCYAQAIMVLLCPPFIFISVDVPWRLTCDFVSGTISEWKTCCTGFVKILFRPCAFSLVWIMLFMESERFSTYWKGGERTLDCNENVEMLIIIRSVCLGVLGFATLCFMSAAFCRCCGCRCTCCEGEKNGPDNNTENGQDNNTAKGQDNNTENGQDNNTENGQDNNTENGQDNNTAHKKTCSCSWLAKLRKKCCSDQNEQLQSILKDLMEKGLTTSALSELDSEKLFLTYNGNCILELLDENEINDLNITKGEKYILKKERHKTAQNKTKSSSKDKKDENQQDKKDDNQQDKKDDNQQNKKDENQQDKKDDNQQDKKDENQQDNKDENQQDKKDENQQDKKDENQQDKKDENQQDKNEQHQQDKK